MSFLQSRTRSAREGFGKPILRKEDARLLVGGGCYSDDVNVPGQTYACFVRSPHGHAHVGSIDTAAALATPGVLVVLTGDDAVADGVKPLTHTPMPGNPHEDMLPSSAVAFIAPHPPMPADRVRFVGEIVAMVIGETPFAARDGAERVEVAWTPLPAVTASAAELARGEALVLRGDPARRIPSCIECHGQKLTGVIPAIPGVLGLPRNYLVGEFGAWRNGQRQAASPDCMADIAKRLGNEDVAAVASWLAAQPMPADTRPAASVKLPLPIDCGSGLQGPKP